MRGMYEDLYGSSFYNRFIYELRQCLKQVNLAIKAFNMKNKA